MTTTPTPTPTPGPAPTRKALFYGSLALNVFLIGVLVAAWTIPHGGRWHHFRHGPPEMFSIMHGIGGDEAEAIRERHKSEIRARIDTVRSARADVAAKLAAEPFDAAAFANSLGVLQQASNEAQVAFHAAFLELAPTLSPEERARLAKRMSRGGKGDKGD